LKLAAHFQFCQIGFIANIIDLEELHIDVGAPKKEQSSN
jgi:hypothetical protein